MLTVEKIDLVTNQLLVEQISFVLEKGSIAGLSAPNGSGKSTLMRTIAGMRKEKSGEIFIKEQELYKKKSEAKKEIFYFETSNWFQPYLSGMDYLQLISDQWKTEKVRIQEMIDYWQLAAFINQPIRKNSLGMNQKILLSMYGVSDAAYWFLDEPTLGLDKTSIARLTDYLQMEKRKGKGIFFSAHENDDFFEICDHRYCIEQRFFKKIY